MKPRLSYIVCATPRSGSGLLCEVLWKTRLAGKPDEYFNVGAKKEYSVIWKTKNFSEYLKRAIKEGTTPNGIFGAKMFPNQLRYFKSQVSKQPQYKQFREKGLMESVFPNLSRYIWMIRKDKVRQAVSLWKRFQTGVHKWDKEEPFKYTKKIKFDFPKINRLVSQLYAGEEYWRNYFKETKIKPFIVTYEDDLEYGYENVTKRILAYLGVTVNNNIRLETTFKKQSDELTEEFVHRYHRIKENH